MITSWLQHSFCSHHAPFSLWVLILICIPKVFHPVYQIRSWTFPATDQVSSNVVGTERKYPMPCFKLFSTHWYEILWQQGVVLSAIYYLLNYNWSCWLDRFVWVGCTWTETSLTNQIIITAALLPHSICHQLVKGDGLFQSIYSHQRIYMYWLHGIKTWYGRPFALIKLLLLLQVVITICRMMKMTYQVIHSFIDQFEDIDKAVRLIKEN